MDHEPRGQRDRDRGDPRGRATEGVLIMSYAYQGDPAGSRSMDVEAIVINRIDEAGLWVTVYDPEEMECELVIAGLTPDRLAAFMEDWVPSRGK